MGFLPPTSSNPEERTFVELLSKFFVRTVVFQGIGIKGLDLRHLRSLPSRLAKRHLPTPSHEVSTGILPILPIRSGLVAGLSASMIRRRLTQLTGGKFQEWVFWTRFPSPELVGAVRGLPFGRIVYEAVDRYSAEPLFSPRERRRVEAAEAELSKSALVITASSGLAKRFEGAIRETYWLPIGLDASLKANASRVPADMARPRLAVVGSLDELADEELLFQVASQRPEWQLVLAGPRDRLWGRSLETLTNVHWLGAMRPDEARGVIADCDVALNPCVLNEWTKTALPVKIFDYLAEGKPTVSTEMGELDMFGDLIELAPAAQFVSAIERALAEHSPEAVARRREASKRYTLQERARRAFELVTEVREEVRSRRPA